MNLIKGIDVKLYVSGIPETVKNVLVGEPSSADMTELSTNDGKLLAYTIAIPKGDTHDWANKRVDFFGRSFRTVGLPVEGIEENIPLGWNKKIRAELLNVNGSCTFYDKTTYKKHVFTDVYFYDNRGENFTKTGVQTVGEINIIIYAVNNDNFSYVPKIGDIVVYGECEFEFDTTSQKSVSESMAQFRKLFQGCAFVTSSQRKAYGNTPDFIITAR